MVRVQRWLGVVTLVAIALLAAASCRAGPTLVREFRTDRTALRTLGDDTDQPILVHYALARAAAVSLWLEDAAGARYQLREDQWRLPGQEYELRLDGSYGIVADGLERRVLPTGCYQMRLQAVDSQGYREEAAAQVRVEAADSTPPRIDALQAEPAVISPRFDARNDTTHITFRLTKDARVSLYATDAQGRKAYVGVHDEQRAAGEYAETWAGLVNDRPLPDGRYFYTVEARDRAGNVTVARTPVGLIDGGLPEARITSVQIRPRHLVLGGQVQVEVGVRNTGPTVLRTQGPDPGYSYTSYESFGSIADGMFIDRAGLWRVGIDWQGAPVTTDSRFPYRWGFGHDLAPGEEVRVRGTITVLHRVTTLWFYAGLVQEGHGYFDVGRGRALVEVSF